VLRPKKAKIEFSFLMRPYKGFFLLRRIVPIIARFSNKNDPVRKSFSSLGYINSIGFFCAA
jgi:hypothetical protein